MPGLLGYFRHGAPDRADVERQLDRMVAAVRPRHRVHAARWTDPRVGLVQYRFGPRDGAESAAGSSPDTGRAAGPVTFFDGFLLNATEIAAELRASGWSGHPIDDEAALLRSAYLRDGTDVAERLHGSFNACVYDPAASRLELFNCRHGARHLFCRSTPRYFAFAYEAKALVALDDARPGMDDLALFDMFNFGYLGGTRTLFAGIELLDHATVATVLPGRVDRRRYWDYRYQNTGPAPTEADLVTEGAALLRQAVGRYAARFRQLGVPLSGGLDSRTILGFAAEQRRSLPVFHCSWYDLEARFAHQLCQAAGGCWHEYDPATLDLAEATAEGADISDGNVHAHQFWFLPVVRQVQQQGWAELLLDGYLMDVFFGDTFLVLPQRPRYTTEQCRDLVNSIWRRGRPGFVHGAFTSRFASAYEEANRHSIDACLATIDEEHISNIIQRFSLANRSNRYSVALPNVHRQFVEYGYPGLDYQVTDFYLRLPPAVKEGARFYRRLICQALPASAAVPWAKTGKPLSVDKGWLSRRLGRLPARQLASMLLLRATGGRVDCSYRGDLNRRFRRDPVYRSWLTELLRDPRTASRGYIDRAGIERLIGFVDRGWPVLSLVQSLVTVELWQRRFVDG